MHRSRKIHRTFEIASRYLEKSNVNAVDEMVNMIANMRGFQVGHKVTDSIDETLKNSYNLQHNIIKRRSL